MPAVPQPDGDVPNGIPMREVEAKDGVLDGASISPRKRVVIIGLGMVGISFIEKLMNLDAKRREYDIIVIGDEPHLAYNRVGLTSFFEHRKVENLYLNPQTWVSLDRIQVRTWYELIQ
jgi:nitrite reductase (NAD(P)H)